MTVLIIYSQRNKYFKWFCIYAVAAFNLATIWPATIDACLPPVAMSSLSIPHSYYEQLMQYWKSGVFLCTALASAQLTAYISKLHSSQEAGSEFSSPVGNMKIHAEFPLNLSWINNKHTRFGESGNQIFLDKNKPHSFSLTHNSLWQWRISFVSFLFCFLFKNLIGKRK